MINNNSFALGSLALLFSISLFGCNSVEKSYISKVKKEFNSQPILEEEILKEADIAHFPAPVKKYLEYTGFIGKSKLQNLRLAFEEEMYRKPNGTALPSSSVQYNFFNRPARLFFMKASMFIIPFRVLHAYSEEKATMWVRVASLFNAVDISGKDLSMAETVTVLNDMCLFAPAALIHKNISWEEIDSHSAKVIFKNGPFTVSAILYFNDMGELINFVSEDRYALQDDGTLKRARWSTPVKDYKEFNGIKVSTYGKAIWHYPEGNFTYGIFHLKDIRFNVKEYLENK
ncbi:MAG: hypothetical protein H7A23_04715 [Leptospiraceae bacterium]|nr:hypothetical protein [Leptospiraceae bacterium]MCP5493837.1 hypothetical protein [Leptospiraceae bacterium]